MLRWLLRKAATPPPSQDETIHRLAKRLLELESQEASGRAMYMEMVSDLVEARQMAGAGPWKVSPAAIAETDRIIAEAQDRAQRPLGVRESTSLLPRGASVDLEFLLANGDWQRISSTSWLEFSRWGIQQLILVCRLYYIKHPWIRRGVNISAAYVFGQGVELSSPDPDANEQLKRFRDNNKAALGQIALTEAERVKSYDGNIFWCLFPDTQNTGEVAVRTIDATEITEIICDPNDATVPWFYKREWLQRTYDASTGAWNNSNMKLWYPAMSYQPENRPAALGEVSIMWDAVIYHRKVGHIANWTFGCPRVFAAIDWAKQGKRHLDQCAKVTKALSDIAIHISTKGGQAGVNALEKKLRGPSSDIADLVDDQAGSTLITGPGAALNVLRTRGAGAQPEEVKEYRNMAACCLDVPPTWLGDMETSNLSTAQTLDRPTELGFLLRQEEWQEDLSVMGIYALQTSARAPSGRLRGALQKRPAGGEVRIQEASRVLHRGHWKHEAAKIRQPGVIEVLCNFPAIREGDIGGLVSATVSAMTLGTQSVIGIDEKAGVRKLLDLLGFDDADQIVEQMYPEKEYEMDRTLEPEPEPEPTAAGSPATAVNPIEVALVRRAVQRVNAALALAKETNGNAAGAH